MSAMLILNLDVDIAISSHISRSHFRTFTAPEIDISEFDTIFSKRP